MISIYQGRNLKFIIAPPKKQTPLTSLGENYSKTVPPAPTTQGLEVTASLARPVSLVWWAQQDWACFWVDLGHLTFPVITDFQLHITIPILAAGRW